jgi:hypothetical protein
LEQGVRAVLFPESGNSGRWVPPILEANGNSNIKVHGGLLADTRIRNLYRAVRLLNR